MPGDTAGLAIEALSSAPQDFLNGKLTSALSLNLGVTRQASGSATGVETKTFTASVSAQQFSSLTALVTAIKTLPEREQFVMSMYYEQDMNLKEIAAVLNITESRVCQLHSQSVARLRAKMRAH